MKERVADVGSRICALYVIVWRSATGNAINICGSHANGRRELANERIKHPSENLFIEQATRQIAAVRSDVFEPLIDKRGIVSDAAEEAVTREIYTSVHTAHPTPPIFIVGACALTQFLLGAIPHLPDIPAKWIEW